jgi:hypothetical protein
MPSKVFISYRRDSARWQAREIYRALKQVLPSDHVFMDVDSIPVGVDFVEYLEGWVDRCDIMLALIGAEWADAIDPKTGRRRLENAHDFMRIEVRKGLARGIPVVPILLDGATIPDPEQLPDDLQRLIRRNAEFIDHRTIEPDVERLIKKLGLTGQSIQRAFKTQVVAGPVTLVDDPSRAEDHMKLTGRQPKESKTQLNRLKFTVRQVRWGWIGLMAAAVLVIWPGSTRITIDPDADLIEVKLRKERASQVALVEAEAKRLAEEAAPSRAEVTPASGQSFRDKFADGQPCPFCPDMVIVPAGTFTMGSPPSEPGRLNDEEQVRVTIARPFAVGKFAVTFDQWDACVADGGCNGYKPNDTPSSPGTTTSVSVWPER